MKYYVSYVIKAATEDGFSVFAHVRSFRKLERLYAFIFKPPQKFMDFLRPGLYMVAKEDGGKVIAFNGVTQSSDGVHGAFYAIRDHAFSVHPLKQISNATSLPVISGIESVFLSLQDDSLKNQIMPFGIRADERFFAILEEYFSDHGEPMASAIAVALGVQKDPVERFFPVADRSPLMKNVLLALQGGEAPKLWEAVSFLPLSLRQPLLTANLSINIDTLFNRAVRWVAKKPKIYVTPHHRSR